MKMGCCTSGLERYMRLSEAVDEIGQMGFDVRIFDLNLSLNEVKINGLGVAPSACLVRDGKLVTMAEEERFNRLKGSFGLMPEKAAGFCLDYAGITLKDVDYISFGWALRPFMMEGLRISMIKCSN